MSLPPRHRRPLQPSIPPPGTLPEQSPQQPPAGMVLPQQPQQPAGMAQQQIQHLPQNNNQPAENYDVVAASMMTNNAAVVAALQGKCDFPKNKLLMNLTKDVNERGHRLEKQPYYVGMLNAEDVAPYLKKIGDFGIHASDQEGGQLKLTLTLRGASGVYHFDLVFDGKGRGWNLNPRSPGCLFHKTIIEMVEYYKTTPLPIIPEKICLRASITRPSWFLKHDNVTYGKNDLLGKGNFCEVFLGKLDRRKFIAVKVCRANWRYTIDTVECNAKEKDA
uniref:SH2 domain-containing protein n=1 Tax=Panagrolaimus sp. PS1159 TaxID=55785 RepID=A0AC35FDV6_9BILA